MGINMDIELILNEEKLKRLITALQIIQKEIEIDRLNNEQK